MSAHDAVEALRRLGLSNYEARVFVALQQLGTGTAQEVSEVSEVPRSQVYGAAADLADRGLVEVVASSPKRFRPVSLDAARGQLSARLEREQERAFQTLEALQDDRADEGGTEAVTTLRGRQPIHERLAALVAGADEQVVLVAARAEDVSTAVVDALRDRAAAGTQVILVTETEAVADRVADAPVRTVLREAGRGGEATGRTLLVDEATVLLSVVVDDATHAHDELALWTADSNIGRILAQFVHAGMESMLDDYGE